MFTLLTHQRLILSLEQVSFGSIMYGTLHNNLGTNFCLLDTCAKYCNGCTTVGCTIVQYSRFEQINW